MNLACNILHILVCLLYSEYFFLRYPASPTHFLAVVYIANPILGKIVKASSLFLVFINHTCCLHSFSPLVENKAFPPFPTLLSSMIDSQILETFFFSHPCQILL